MLSICCFTVWNFGNIYRFYGLFLVSFKGFMFYVEDKQLNLEVTGLDCETYGISAHFSLFCISVK